MNLGRLLQCIGVAGLSLLLNVPPTSAQLHLVGLTNSIWAYSIDNSDQYTLGFPNVDTSHWPKGRALFGNDASGGYPYPFLVTVPGSAGGVQSSYYQTSFQWSGGIAGVMLAMTNYVDDGVVIYLNGVEITRWNINAPPGVSVGHNTMATAANPGGEPVRVVHRVPLDVLTNGIPNPLMPGQNVLAVSLHQAGTGSGDTVFGLSVGTEGDTFLCGFVLPAATNVVQCRTAQFVLTIPPQCQEPDSIQWFHNETPLVGQTGRTLTLTNVQPALDDGVYYARLQGSAGQIINSSRATLSVTPDTAGPRIQSVTGVWGADDQWLVTFDEPVELFGGAADSFAYEIRQVDNTDETLPVIDATLQPNGHEVILVTEVSRMTGSRYTYTTLQPIHDACARNATASGMTGPVFLQNAILDYGDFRLWRYSDDATDYGADWRADTFDDSGWSSGRQLFHRNRASLDATSVAGQAVGTFLELTNYTANPPTNLATVYLRLKLPVPASAIQLTGFPIYDDGFILYVNGVEAYRTNVTAAADQWANYSGGSSIEAGTPSFMLPFEIPISAVTVGAENTLAVMLKQVNGTSGDLTFGLRIVATVPDFVADPVVFTQLPVATTVTEGHLLTLRVRTSGTSPSYQWYRQGIPIPGATSEVYSKVAELSDAGEYRVDVRGFAGSLQSSPPVPVTVRPVVTPYGLVWRYSTNSQNATLSTTPWYAPAFDDLSWAAGSGPFGFDVSAATLARLPAPLATLLPPPDASFLTTYFRTTVEIPTVPAGSTVALFHLVDDGAIFYVDGIRRLNYNGPATNPTLSEDLAPGIAPGDGDAMIMAAPFTLTPGLHTFAVEVHQNLPNSSDVIFGAEVRIINDNTAPALTITRSATGGMQLSWPDNPIYSLYWATAIGGPFTPVANDPQGTYLVPNPGLDANIFFQLRLNGR